jgi:hypothetical protein
MTITRRAAIGAAILYSLIAAFQFALALGAPWGKAAFGGAVEQPGLELRASSVVAIVVWSAAALIVLKRVGFTIWAPLPRKALPVAVWVLIGLSVVSNLLNAITPSALERAIWLPFSLLLTAALLVVAITSRRTERVAR